MSRRALGPAILPREFLQLWPCRDILGKFGLFPRLPVQRVNGQTIQVDIKRICTPSGSPPRTYVLVDLFVDLIRQFVSCSGEGSILILRILELVQVRLRFSACPYLGSSVGRISFFRGRNGGKHARGSLSGRALSFRTNIKTGRAIRSTWR